jgi:2-polyprenyl-6-hydroxyphenyl methylase/3-demethylubiquinone-9 3-methyltransferase
MNVTSQHAAEVASGKRFEFGRNWRRFLVTLNPERIMVAEASLRRMLKIERLDGLSFLDIGSGSGLFSLAARRLGARVHSFDYDTSSVACTAELKRRYFPGDKSWIIEQGSVLDRAYLQRLGTFDIVYSWGVLHHTGAMWQALDNVKLLVKMGGNLFIAVYNDAGPLSQLWTRIKRTYNDLPRVLRLPFAFTIVAASEARAVADSALHLKLGDHLRTWTHYARTSTRGMSRWHDWIDWIGGYPYEYVSIEACADFFLRDGFAVNAIVDRSMGYGCNEYVFTRKAPLGTLIDQELPASRWFARRYGKRLGPFRRNGAFWDAPCRERPANEPGGSLFVGCDDVLLGPAVLVDAEGGLAVRLAEGAQAPDPNKTYRIYCAQRRPLVGPFTHLRGHLWRVPVPDLASLGDDRTDDKSPLCILEDGRQLSSPRVLHAHIARYGGGRFSHWGEFLYFSPRDSSNPNRNGHRYEILYRSSPDTC